MTIHDKLEEILEKHEKELDRWDIGIALFPTPSTIAAIIQAVEERLPGETEDFD